MPEPKTVKNRLHLDLHVADHSTPYEARKPLVDGEVERLVALGASRPSATDDATTRVLRLAPQ